jgi:cellulose 1,4-beta-cellobiosidase
MRIFLSAVCAAASGTALGANPFASGDWYVNPAYQSELDTSIATATGAVKATLQSMREVPSAYWLDVKAKITGNDTHSMAGILADAASRPTPPLVTFIVYDLPNRDCRAKASNGEICCNPMPDGTCDYDAGGDCAAGLKEYETEYIDPLVAVLKAWDAKVPIALIIEPDSLPNLATNLADPHCGNTATQASYKQGIPYAVNAIAAATTNTVMYLDAAHGGWLGWEDNLEAFVALFKDMDIAPHLRGFSTNVANYQPVGTMCPGFGDFDPANNATAATWRDHLAARNDYCLNGGHQTDACCADPCKLEGQYDPGNNEMNFVGALSAAMRDGVPGFAPQFVIDTGRNGVATERKDCANWCNPRGAGIGHVPTLETGQPLVDAFFWLKTPGESDGCTQMLPDGSACPRFDSFCGSADSVGSAAGEPRCPQAGAWFDYYVKMLAANANMGPVPAPTPASPTPPPTPPPPPPPSTPTPPPSTPTPPPSTPTPAPAPSGCPGGSLTACMDLCPSDPPAAYQACVESCVKRCT